eukprot:2662475-Rhodomonas_salina.2
MGARGYPTVGEIALREHARDPHPACAVACELTVPHPRPRPALLPAHRSPVATSRCVSSAHHTARTQPGRRLHPSAQACPLIGVRLSICIRTSTSPRPSAPPLRFSPQLSTDTPCFLLCPITLPPPPCQKTVFLKHARFPFLPFSLSPFSLHSAVFRHPVISTISTTPRGICGPHQADTCALEPAPCTCSPACLLPLRDPPFTRTPAPPSTAPPDHPFWRTSHAPTSTSVPVPNATNPQPTLLCRHTPRISTRAPSVAETPCLPQDLTSPFSISSRPCAPTTTPSPATLCTLQRSSLRLPRST